MRERTTKKDRPSTQDERDERVESESSLAKRGEDIKSDIDDLLEEIDEVLEKNAAEFVAGYVQRGGE